MEKIERRDHIAHLITDPKSEDPKEMKDVIGRALTGAGGVIVTPVGRTKREVFSSEKVRRIEDATPEEIGRYIASVTLFIINTAQSATIVEFYSSSNPMASESTS